MTLVLRYSARSDRGLVRQNNQDSVYAGPRLLALADGMGGHAAGEVASKLVIAALVPLDDDEPGDDLLGELAEATAQGNDAITELVAEEPDLDGMGTTLTAVLFAGTRLGMVHVGDSRAYLFRDSTLTQITRDDTFVQSLIDEGRITEDEAASHPQRSLLLRALTGHDVEPALTVREARAGDRYLLCSDGLSGVVSAETLAEALTIADPQACSDRLIELALKGGGPDNVTCIVADVVDIDFGEHVPIYGGAAGDGRADPPPGDSAAARASAATLTRSRAEERPTPVESPRATARPRRPRMIAMLAALAAVAVVAVGILVAWMWMSSQYYVGVAGDEVVVYQGVRGSVLGFQTQEVAEPTGLRLTDLDQVGRGSVTGEGSYSGDLPGARQAVQTLRSEYLLPECPKQAPVRQPAPGAPAPAPGAPGAAPAPARGASHRRHRTRARSRLPTGALTHGAPRHPSRAGSAAAGVEMPADRTALRPIVAAAVSTRRGVELAMLAFAALITTGALVLVEANQEKQLTPALLYLGAAYLGLFGAAHVAVRYLAPYADPLALPLAALLNGIGLVMIHRIDLAKIARATALGNAPPSQDAIKQIGWTAIGLVLFVIVLAYVKDHRTLARFGYTAGFAGLALLALPAVLPSALSEVNGAKIWIRVGGVGIQPGEFAKILLVVFFASFLVTKRDLFTTAGKHFLGMTFPRPRDLGPLLVAWGISMAVLVLESDLGTSLMFFGIVLAMLYIATERVSWVLIGLTIFGAGAFAAWTFVSRVQIRVDVWLNPFADFNDRGFQVGNALFGLATGGVGGTGLGAGRPDLVPFANTDFIITSVGEELGLVGLAAVLLLYVLLSTRAMRSALAVRDTFGKFLAGGLGFAIAWQVFVVAGGVINLIPNTGQTAPFMSYGGSSLVANYALVALVLRVSNAARQPAPDPPERTPAQQAPIAEAHTEMVSRDQVAATPPQGQPTPGQQTPGRRAEGENGVASGGRHASGGPPPGRTSGP